MFDGDTLAKWAAAALLLLFVLRTVADPFGLGVVFGVVMLGLMVALLYLRPLAGPFVSLDHRALLIPVALFTSAIASRVPKQSLVTAAKISVGFMLFVAAGQLIRLGVRPHLLSGAVLVSAAIPFFVALVQLVTGAGTKVEVELFSDESLTRITGTFVNANSMALFALVVCAAAVVQLFDVRHQSRVVRVYSGVLGLTSLVLIVFSYTRSVMIGAAVGVLFALYRMRPRWAIGGVVALLLLPLLIPSIGSRFSDLTSSPEVDVATFNGTADSFEWRLQYWTRLSKALPEAPLTGQGIGSTEVVQPEKLQPHNTFLQLALETGTLGTVAVFSLIGGVWRRLSKLNEGDKIGFPRAAALGLIVAYSISAISENTLAAVSIGPLMVLLRMVLELASRPGPTARTFAAAGVGSAGRIALEEPEQGVSVPTFATVGR